MRCVVAYHGGAFHGFARQPSVRTVQGVLESAVLALDPEASEVRGTSRTDAGVHARGQVVAFDSARPLPEKGFRMLLNQALPDDVSVREVDFVAFGYAPRFDAVRKEYRYTFRVGEARDPIRDAFCWHVDPSRALRARRGEDGGGWLDLAAMRSACEALVGTHDFAAYRSADDAREGTVRTLERIELVEPALAPDELVLIVVGPAFMKNMVRILAGTVLEVGSGRRTLSAVHASLAPGAPRASAGTTAPAHGLCLHGVQLGRSVV